MTDERQLPTAVERALEEHEAFEPSDDGYALTTTVFDVTVTAEPAEGQRDGQFCVTVAVPSLSTVVVGEGVAPIVETDWAETFERRVEDAFTVARTDTHEDPIVDRTGETIRVTLAYTTWDAAEGVADAKALAEFVEGTYAQGLIPGYEYRGAAATLRSNAQSRGQQAANGGGTPL